ncbi:MAG: hypothetical protein JW822_09320 [Spirochaetales bacterium]|nr:hypothetical protein [Spirochaetales bacterium]
MTKQRLLQLLTVFLLITAFGLFFLSCAPPGGSSGGGPEDPPDPPSGGGIPHPDDVLKSSWTVIIQFAMDNNIDYFMENDFGLISDYLQTLEQIEANDLNDNIDIVILFDAYSTDSQGVGYVSDFTDGYYHLTGGSFEDDLVVTVAEINSGSLSQTTEFLDWAVDNYPADGYMYSVFNHGGGFDDDNIEGTFAAVRGIAFDEDSGDCLSHYELEQATAFLKNKIGANIDLFYAYACLMGGVELAYQIRNNANYILFSEELFPAEYWSYEALKVITDNEAVSAFDIGKSFCDSAYDYFTNVQQRSFCLSLVRLDLMDELSGLLDEYALSAIDDIRTNSNAFEYYKAASWARSMAYDNNFDDNVYYYLDLGSYLYEVSDLININEDVRALAVELIHKMSDYVVYQKDTIYFHINYKIMGLTIFHNMWYSEYNYPVDTYRSILSFGQTAWSDYQEEYLAHRINLSPDSYESDNTKDQTDNTIAIGETQLHTSFPIPKSQVFGNYLDRDFIRLDLSGITPGTTLKIETFPNTVQHVPHSNVSSEDYVRFCISKYEISCIENSRNKEDGHALLIWACDDPDLYYIDVTSWDMTDYLISVTQVADVAADEYENDDTSDLANEITENSGFQTHSAHIKNDVDWLYFDGTAGSYYCVVLDNSMNVRVAINVYAEDDLTNPITAQYLNYNEYFGFNCRETKQYYIKITVYDIHEVYNVRLEAVDGFLYGSHVEGYSNSTQGHLEPQGYYSVYNFHCTYDTEDFFALNLVDVEPGTQIRIETTPLSTDGIFENPKQSDTELFLYDVPGIELAYDDDSGTDSCSRIVFTCDEPGRYFIKIRSKGADVIGNYCLGVFLVE